MPDGEAGNIGNVTGAEEVAVGGTGKQMGKKESHAKGTQKDEALEKGGFGAVTGAEEVKAKLWRTTYRWYLVFIMTQRTAIHDKKLSTFRKQCLVGFNFDVP
jgi:hypothetical protein